MFRFVRKPKLFQAPTMNFFTFHLGVALSLLVLIQNCGQTFAAPKPCKSGCKEKQSYNSGYSAISPSVLSTPLLTPGVGAAGNHGAIVPVANQGHADLFSGFGDGDILGLSNVVKTLLDIILHFNIPISILSPTLHS